MHVLSDIYKCDSAIRNVWMSVLFHHIPSYFSWLHSYFGITHAPVSNSSTVLCNKPQQTHLPHQVGLWWNPTLDCLWWPSGIVKHLIVSPGEH